jgi:hypothetical protein
MNKKRKEFYFLGQKKGRRQRDKKNKHAITEQQKQHQYERANE